MKKKVKPATECQYPNCEACSHYIELNENYYCNVPMVISKQAWIMLSNEIDDLWKRVLSLQDEVR